MTYIIETQKLTKIYKDKTVVNGVDLHVKQGEIYGFVGPNGAGKTTVLKMLLNLVSPDSGARSLFGRDIGDDTFEHLKRIGSIIENPYFYSHLTARENLKLHCGYMGYYNTERIEEVLELVGLKEAENKITDQYSLGMKQRLAIGRAILTQPELLILDEPVNALDPDGIQKMRSLFLRLKEKQRTTIIISSHILSEVEQIADTVGIIKDGVLKREIPISEVHNASMEYMQVCVDDAGKAGCLLEDVLGVTDYKIISDTELRIFEPKVTGRELSQLLVSNGLAPESLFKKKNTLEDYFFQVTEEEEAR